MMKKLLAAMVTGLFALGLSAQNKEMKAYMVADAHLDTQWNWDVQATIRDHIRNTLTQNLFLFKQYPDYIFNFEGAVKYSWMKEYYPIQYEEMKRYVAQGRWHITGSSWDANETIICSPESWLRNVLLGQTFYRTEFNTEGTDIFLPDCFGFGYTLPTLAAHCGLIGFSSQKLMWRTKPFYEGGRRYPFTVGLWQGIDGSRIMMTHGFNYAQRYDDADLSKNENLINEIKESPLNIAYRYYGTGDIGGSPTLASVRAVEKGIHGDGPVQVVSATSDQIYKDFMPYDQHPELPVFDGELPMDVHGNGCYTSQAAMKLYNRQNEHLGDAAERSAVMADWLGTARYPGAQLTQTWQRVIWHQFHDDVTGTSIPRAYHQPYGHAGEGHAAGGLQQRDFPRGIGGRDETLRQPRLHGVLSRGQEGALAGGGARWCPLPLVRRSGALYGCRHLRRPSVWQSEDGRTGAGTADRIVKIYARGE